MRRLISQWFIFILFFICLSSRAQSFDSLQKIRITVTFSSAPSTYSVTKAPLRYNKLFAFSLEEDDGDKDIYTTAYPFLNGGVISGSTYPGLMYTDGCGNTKKFKMSASIFSFSLQGSNLIDMHDPSGPYVATTVTWPQLIEMYQQNWGVSNHGLTSGGGGTPGYEVARNGSYIKLMMQSATAGGPDIKIFINPNGSESYSPFAWAQGYNICYREGYPFGDPGFNVSGAFPHQNFGMHRTNGYESISLSAIVNSLATASTGGAHQWGVMFTHSVTNASYGYSFSTFQNYMNYVANTYGKNGLDNILMASEEEVYDYLMVRDSINVNTQLSGKVLTITFTGSLANTYKFYNSTLLISANQNISSIATQGVQTSSYTGVGSANGMVNLSWNGHYIIPPEVNAETWVSKTEASHNQEDANVAMDYILMIPTFAAQRPYRIRLCAVSGITLPSGFCSYRNAPVSTLPNTGGCPGHALVIPVAIDSFLNITTCNQRIEYDPAIMTFVSGTAGKPLIISGMQITDQAVGSPSTLHKILISWSGATPKSLAAHDTLALLNFNYISGNSALAYNTSSNSGNDCKYTDEGGNPMYQSPPGNYYINGQVTNARLPAPGTISGPSILCAGTSNNTYTVSPVTGATSYAWTFPGGFTITQGAGSNTVVVTAGPDAVSGNTTVRAVNVCNDNPLSPSFPITVKARPVPVINGVNSSCAMGPALVYSTDAGMTDYSWTVSSGGNIVSGQGTNFISVTWTIPGSQTVSVVYRGTNGCLAPVPTVKNVTVNPLPVPVITGMDTLCRTVLYAYATTPGMLAYQWQVSPSGTIVSGASSATINATWNNTGPQWISLNYSNLFGCQALSPVIKNIFVRPIAQPVITGPDSLCEGSAGIVYITQSGMNGYSWFIPSGGTITAGAGTSSVTVQWTVPGIHQIQLNYTVPGGCSASNPVTLQVNVHARPQPDIYGPDSLCMNTTGIYTTESGMNNYQWVISPGGSIVSGLGTDSIHVKWTTTGPQTVSVNYLNEKNCSAASPSNLNVNVFPLPLPGISGHGTVCANYPGEVYSTEAGMVNYEWATSTSGSIISGQGTSSVTVNWANSGTSTISVTYSSPKGCNPTSPTIKTVTVNPRPIPVISGSAALCFDTLPKTYSTQAGQLDYIWAISSGDTILHGTGTSTLTVKWTFVGNHWISVTYTSPAGCLAMTPDTLPVSVITIPSPASAISGPSLLCAPAFWQEYSINPISSVSAYHWALPVQTVFQGSDNSNIIHCTYLPDAQSGYVTVYGSNICGNGIPSNLFVTVVPTPPQPVITLNQDNTLVSSSLYGNQWYLNDQPLTGDTLDHLNVELTGDYYTIVTLDNCSSDTSNIQHAIAVGITENTAFNASVYPNPANGKLIVNFITSLEKTCKIILFDELGIKLYESERIIPKGESSWVIDLKNMSAGPGILVIQSSDGIIRKKIIKN